MHDNAIKRMDDVFLFQRIPFIFEEVNSKRHLSIKVAFSSSRWAWFTCYVGSHKTNITIWPEYGHLTFSHIPCPMTFRCEMFQAFQNNF